MPFSVNPAVCVGLDGVQVGHELGFEITYVLILKRAAVSVVNFKITRASLPGVPMGTVRFCGCAAGLVWAVTESC